jgi:hypothetical protein
MNKNSFDQLNFDKKFRLSRRTIFLVALQLGFAFLWRTAPVQVLFWILMIVICVLGWMASYGWRIALRDFRFWLEQITREEF